MNLKSSLNKKQFYTLEINNYYRPEILMLDGAFRSGKSVIDNICFLQHVDEFQSRKVDFIMTGYSIGSLERNVLKPLRDDYGINTTLDKYNRFELFGNMINCFGTSNADDDEAMQGMTAYGWLANELTLTHINAFKMAMSRCSGIGARKFWDMNPANPSHYLYKTYIEPWMKTGNNRKLCRVSWKMRDNDQAHNGFLTDDYIQGMERDYTGIWHKKYIQGQWVAIEGQIYFIEELQYYDDEILNEKNWWLGTVINGYLDPATGSQKKTGCFTSIISGAFKNDFIYILPDVVVAKHGVEGTISEAGRLLNKYNYSQFAYEDNFSQDEYVGTPLKRACPFANIIGQSSREDKLSRLVGMQNVIKTKVKFPKSWVYESNTQARLLLQQLENITPDRDDKAESDEEFMDGPDALEGLIRTFRNYSGTSAKLAATGDTLNQIREAQTW